MSYRLRFDMTIKYGRVFPGTVYLGKLFRGGKMVRCQNYDHNDGNYSDLDDCSEVPFFRRKLRDVHTNFECLDLTKK